MSTPLAADHLSELVELLHHIRSTRPLAVGIASTDGHIELAVRALDPDDPGLALTGFLAPAHWDAFAISATGTATSSTDTLAVEVVHLVTREGHERCDVHGVEPPARAVSGWVPDVCRRVLGLATAPPSTTTADLLASWWLDAILGLILGADLDRPPPDWPRCCALLGEMGRQPLGPLGARVAHDYPWPLVRRWATRRPICGVPCETATWLDDGSFARFVLGGFGLLDEMRADVEELLDPPTATRLAAVLDQWPLTADR